MKLKRIAALMIIAALLLSYSVVYAGTDGAQGPVSALGEMKKAAENDYLELYIDDKTTEVAVKDKKTGFVWYTNPEGKSEDSKAGAINKDRLSSQISISYYTPTSQTKLMNNYTDCIRHEQFEITPIENGVRIFYRIGREEKIFIVPRIISKSRMEEKILSKLDEKTGKTLVRNYREISLEKAGTEEKRNEILAEFPSAEQGDIYVLSDNIREFMFKNLQEMVASAGYTLEDMNEDHIANDVPVAEANLEIFKIPLEYILEGDNLVVRVPTDEIEYNKDSYPIYDIHLLEFFGAAGEKEKGYILVPDGSGSLIYLNNNKMNTQGFAIDVYGLDQSIPLYERTSIIEQAYLPVFGMKRGENAFFSIIESGDALSSVWADISGRQNSYNTVYSKFVLVQNDILDIGDYSGNNTIMVYQPRVFKGDIKLRYKFLGGKDSDYAGMAAYYRSYLEKNHGLTRAQPKENVPFYLEVIGAIDKVRPVLGIPLKTIQPLTTYEQTIEIIRALTDSGVKGIVLKYTGWANGGIDHTLPSKVKLISQLGGSKGFKKLQAFLNEKSIEYFPELGIIYNYKDTIFDGFIPMLHASRYITKEIASIYKFNLATNLPHPARGIFYIISPLKIPSIVEGMIKGLKNLSITGLSLKDAAIDLNSDYKEKKLVDRQQALEIVKGEIKKIKDSGLSVMVQGGNFYALPYTNHILNIPEESNQFHLVDESIPFFQMAVRGYMDYAGAPINMSPDYKKAFLKAMETGSGIYFSFIYEENSVVKESYFDNYYSNEYRAWINEARDFYRQANDALGDTQGQTIRDHKRITDGVYKTTFENGKEIVVNYNSKPVEVEGVRVDALDFKVVKGGK